jgi:hypothetical protein
MMLYPYLSAFILTDDLYERFGGILGAASPDLRQAAYQIAESAIYYDLETPLQRTTFTGTYKYSSHLLLDHAYVDQIIATQYLDSLGDVFYTISGSFNTSVHLDDPVRGVVRLVPRDYLGCQSSGYLTQVRIVYTAGLTSGTSYEPRILTALTQYAIIQINELVGYGNEAPGDVGVKSYSNQEYSEDRVALLRTAYGGSAKANFIHTLLSPYRKHRVVGW